MGGIGQDRLQLGWAEEVVVADIGQQRAGAQVGAHLAAGGEGVGRHGDLVPGTDAEGLQRQVQGGGTAVEGQGVFGTDALGEGILQRVRPRAGGQPAGAQHLDGGRDLALANGGPMKRNGLGLAPTGAGGLGQVRQQARRVGAGGQQYPRGAPRSGVVTRVTVTRVTTICGGTESRATIR